MSYEDYMSRLHPKVAAAVKTAQETEVVKLPLASHGLTEALGGGLAKGRVTLFYGSTSSGKSAIIQESIGKLWQPQGLVCAYVDTEGTWDKNWTKRLGVNNDELILIESRSSGKIEKEIRPHLENGIDVLVIDSISDILPEVFINKSGEMNEQEDRKQIGSQAKAITALINGIHYLNEDTAVILISQTTTFMGQSYVEQVPHGGQKAQFASSQIIRLTSSASPNQQLKGKEYVGDYVFEIPVGREVDYLVKKNKLGAPFKSGSYKFYYAGKKVGIDSMAEVLDEAVSFDVISKGGAWYTYGEQKFQGMDATVAFFEENPEELELVKKAVHTRKTGEL